MAALLRAAVWVVPLVLSVGAAIVAANLLPLPFSPAGRAAWWTIVLGVSALALLGADRLLRRALPLAALLDVSLAFPHRPPSRFAVLRRTHSIEELQDRIRNGDGDASQIAADLLALVVALDQHDRATRGHSERVRLYAQLVGEELGLEEPDLDRLRWAALLHDIGKLKVPAGILNKGDDLDVDEWRRIRRHPREGARLVEPIADWMGPWAGAIEHHHERVDGTGYPHGLRGEEIALGGRIVAVADAFETMTAARPYKSPLTVAAARQELVSSAGTHFDEDIVRAFLTLSVPRLRHIAGWVAWIAAMPGLWFLSRIPRPAGTGVVAAASVGILAVGGVLAPASPDGPPASTPLAQEPEGQQPAPRDISPAPTAVPTDTPDAQHQDGTPSNMGSRRPVERDPSRNPTTTDGGSDGDDRSGDDAPGDQPPEERGQVAQVGTEDATVLRELYLHASPVAPTLRHPALPMDSDQPTQGAIVNYDTDVDQLPGLRLRPSDRGRAESRPTHHQRWAVDLGAPTTVTGQLSATVWVAGVADTAPVTLQAFADHCAPDLTDCRPIADGSAALEATPGTWTPATVDLRVGGAVMLDGRVLVLTLVSDADVAVAFDTTSHPAVLEVPVGVIVSPELPASSAAAYATSRRGGAGRDQ